MAGKFKVRPIAGHEPVPRFIDPDDSREANYFHNIATGTSKYFDIHLFGPCNNKIPNRTFARVEQTV